ncbi:hypothetical protein WD019_02945 [Fictibacillus sp. Mic-4]|uniref:hypothetical protein n=1 Tax=Fictibacillus sp. Mic-4 TaxID=3132826 RepID=UPI003CF0C59A
MKTLNRAVQQELPHKIDRGDSNMEGYKYIQTINMGKTRVHIYQPENQTEEERKKVLREYTMAGWALWNSLSDEQKIRINEEAMATQNSNQ